MADKKTYSNHSPDYLSLAGAYFAPAKPAAYIAALCQPLDNDLVTWHYWVYALEITSGSLNDQVAQLQALRNIPVGRDGGILKTKAGFGRIRAMYAPTEEPGYLSLVSNARPALMSMLSRSIVQERHIPLKDKPDFNMGFDVFPLDPKQPVEATLDWIDGLYSLLVGDKLTHAPNGENGDDKILPGITFLTHGNDAKKTVEALSQALSLIEINPNGSIKNPDPLAMAMLYTIGQTERLAKLRQLPIQKAQQKASKARASELIKNN